MTIAGLIVAITGGLTCMMAWYVQIGLPSRVEAPRANPSYTKALEGLSEMWDVYAESAADGRDVADTVLLPVWINAADTVFRHRPTTF